MQLMHKKHRSLFDLSNKIILKTDTRGTLAFGHMAMLPQIANPVIKGKMFFTLFLSGV